ncbi:MAG: preprotein translocase subunit SecA [Burkholderiales bacterium]|nr:preprotein translocase subunit SecA [Burkholderiales bacterium]
MFATLTSASPALPMPGVLWGDYPERAADPAPRGIIARLDRAWQGLARYASGWPAARRRRFALRVLAHATARQDCAGPDLTRHAAALRANLARQGFDEANLLEAFALAVLASEEALGFKPYATQIEAARVMLDNRLAEMATGEGKTVAVAMAAAVAALGGIPVHVITANDYLAARDARELASFYRVFGLRADAVTQPMDRAARHRAYRADITYCSAKELAFDYLRDTLCRPRGMSDLRQRARRLSASDGAAAAPVLRGLCMAIIDEADTVLIDEAGMPLVLSRGAQSADSAAFLAGALALAQTLSQDADFEVQPDRRATLTAAGADKVAAWPAAPGRYGEQRRHRENIVCLALGALHVYRRDRDYVVRAGKVLIVDDHTGRTAPGRAWSRGLQQLIEIKEACTPSAALETIAEITFQRFFRRYLRLAGMSGTLSGARRELGAVYGLAVESIAPRTPSLRTCSRPVLHADGAALRDAVVRRAREVHATGRPLLIGTASVAESEALSCTLADAGLPHAVLNARQDQAEAALVAQAGELGRITVATSMAGRGTDIRLGHGVAERGGLKVILCQHNGARRIDRQFIGRAARNGEPGSVDIMLSLDSPLFARWLPRWWLSLAARHASLPAWLLHLTTALPQWLEEHHRAAQRRRLLELDIRRERELDFCQRTAS